MNIFEINVGTNNIFQPNTNSNNICPSKMKQIQIQIFTNYSINLNILNILDKTSQNYIYYKVDDIFIQYPRSLISVSTLVLSWQSRHSLCLNMSWLYWSCGEVLLRLGIVCLNMPRLCSPPATDHLKVGVS